MYTYDKANIQQKILPTLPQISKSVSLISERFRFRRSIDTTICSDDFDFTKVSQSSLRDLLLQCCMDDAPDVRQSAFALLGDLARACPIHLHPRLSEFPDVAGKQLNIPKLKETISVANNACWAIGELAVKDM
ncbi:hypothetical protein ACSBR2_017900 [Camellia fascicularis]